MSLFSKADLLKKSPHLRLFVEKMEAPAKTPVSLSFEQIANGLFDLLRPHLQEAAGTQSQSVEVLSLRHVINLALVIGGQRQACFVTFEDIFRPSAAAPMLDTLATALANLRDNLALPKDFNLVIKASDNGDRQLGGFVAFRQDRVTLPDVIRTLPIMGSALDSQPRLFEPAAKVLGYPLFTVHPEDVPNKDVTRIMVGAALAPLGVNLQAAIAAPATPLIVARYAKVDVSDVQKEFRKIRDAISAVAAGKVVAGRKVVKIAIFHENWADERKNGSEEYQLMADERAGRGDSKSNFQKLDEAAKQQSEAFLRRAGRR